MPRATARCVYPPPATTSACTSVAGSTSLGGVGQSRAGRTGMVGTVPAAAASCARACSRAPAVVPVVVAVIASSISVD